MSAKWISLAGFAALAGSVAALVMRDSLLTRNPVGMALQALAVLLMLWARLTFGGRSFHASAVPTAGGLVTSGPYRFVRHPIYAAVLLFLWSGIAAHLSSPDVGLGLLATAGAAARMLAEERLVRARYPEYVSYAARTKRVIPFLL